MTSIPESTVSSVDAPPIPESLLGPLLDAAADSLESFSSGLTDHFFGKEINEKSKRFQVSLPGQAIFKKNSDWSLQKL